jgi:hypothetical protein
MFDTVALAQHPLWHRAYHAHGDLLVATRRGQMRHRRLEPCLDRSAPWAGIPQRTVGPEFTPSCSVRALSRSPGDLVAVVLDSGRLFWSAPDHAGRWAAWTQEEPQLPGFPPQPVPLATPGTVYAGPSAEPGNGIEMAVTGADGHIYANLDWDPNGSRSWRRLRVAGFTLRRDGDLVLVDDRLFVLDTGGALWSGSVDRSPFLPADPEWERVSPPGVALRTLTVVADSSPVRLLATATDGQVWDATIPSGQPPRWVPLGSPGTVPVPPAVRVAATMTEAQRLDIFVVADGTPFTRTWTESGWRGWERVGGTPLGVRAADRTPLLLHRVNRQLELFVETVDGDLVRTWWS